MGEMGIAKGGYQSFTNKMNEWSQPYIDPKIPGGKNSTRPLTKKEQAINTIRGAGSIATVPLRSPEGTAAAGGITAGVVAVTKGATAVAGVFGGTAAATTTSALIAGGGAVAAVGAAGYAAGTAIDKYTGVGDQISDYLFDFNKVENPTEDMSTMEMMKQAFKGKKHSFADFKKAFFGGSKKQTVAEKAQGTMAIGQAAVATAAATVATKSYYNIKTNAANAANTESQQTTQSQTGQSQTAQSQPTQSQTAQSQTAQTTQSQQAQPTQTQQAQPAQPAQTAGLTKEAQALIDERALLKFKIRVENNKPHPNEESIYYLKKQLPGVESEMNLEIAKSRLTPDKVSATRKIFDVRGNANEVQVYLKPLEGQTEGSILKFPVGDGTGSLPQVVDLAEKVGMKSLNHNYSINSPVETATIKWTPRNRLEALMLKLKDGTKVSFPIGEEGNEQYLPTIHNLCKQFNLDVNNIPDFN